MKIYSQGLGFSLQTISLLTYFESLGQTISPISCPNPSICRRLGMRLCYHESNATDRSPQSANLSICHTAMLPVRPIDPQYGRKQELGKVYAAKPSNAAHDAEVRNPLEILVRNIALINEIYSINVGIQMHGSWPSQLGFRLEVGRC